MWQFLCINTGKVCLLCWLQYVGRANFTSRIALCVAVGNGEAENLSNVLHGTLGKIASATRLNRFDHRDQFRRFDLCNSARPEQRENVGLHTPARRVHMLSALLGSPVVKP